MLGSLRNFTKTTQTVEGETPKGRLCPFQHEARNWVLAAKFGQLDLVRRLALLFGLCARNQICNRLASAVSGASEVQVVVVVRLLLGGVCSFVRSAGRSVGRLQVS